MTQWNQKAAAFGGRIAFLQLPSLNKRNVARNPARELKAIFGELDIVPGRSNDILLPA